MVSAHYLPKCWELKVGSLHPNFREIVEMRVNAHKSEEDTQNKLDYMYNAEFVQGESQFVTEKEIYVPCGHGISAEHPLSV